MIDKWQLWKVLAKSWAFTMMGLFNLVFLCALASFLVMRLAGPEAFLVILMPSLALMTLMFLLGEVLVNIIFQAEVPDPAEDKELIDAFTTVCRKSRILVKPRLRIISLDDMPNAMAYGTGLPFLSSVGVSRPLMNILTQPELEGVLAHEFAHIKCKDVGLLSVIGLLLSLIDKLRNLLKSPKSLITKSPITLVLGWVIYAIGKVALCISRFSISQERELAADALGASYIGDPAPLISGLRKLHSWSKKQKTLFGDDGKEEKPFFHDLMVSHPGLEERIASLESLTPQLKGALS